MREKTDSRRGGAAAPDDEGPFCMGGDRTGDGGEGRMIFHPRMRMLEYYMEDLSLDRTTKRSTTP